MAEKNYVKVGGQLQNIVGDGIIAYSKEIKDEVREKTQEQINTETYEKVAEIDEALESLNPEQQGALALSERVGQLEKEVGYYECSTSSGTATKQVVADGYALSSGCSIKVKMLNKNTAASNVKLQIGSSTAKPLYYAGQLVTASNTWDAGEVLDIYYNPNDGGAYYANNVAGSSGDGVFDISEYNKGGDPLAPTPYADLTSALGTNGANVPITFRRGGMSVKFILSNNGVSTGAYAQYRYTKDDVTTAATFTDTANWQGVTDAVVSGINDVVTSNGVQNRFNDKVGGSLAEYFLVLVSGQSYNQRFPLSLKSGTEYTIKCQNYVGKAVTTVGVYLWYGSESSDREYITINAGGSVIHTPSHNIIGVTYTVGAQASSSTLKVEIGVPELFLRNTDFLENLGDTPIIDNTKKLIKNNGVATELLDRLGGSFFSEPIQITQSANLGIYRDILIKAEHVPNLKFKLIDPSSVISSHMIVYIYYRGYTGDLDRKGISLNNDGEYHKLTDANIENKDIVKIKYDNSADRNIGNGNIQVEYCLNDNFVRPNELTSFNMRLSSLESQINAISPATIDPGYIASASLFYDVLNDAYRHTKIAVTPGQIIELKAGSQLTDYLILKSYPTDFSTNSVVIVPVDGMTDRIRVPAGTTVQFTIPQDGNWLCTSWLWNNVNYAPAYVRSNGADLINGQASLEQRVSVLEEEVGTSNHSFLKYIKSSPSSGVSEGTHPKFEFYQFNGTDKYFEFDIELCKHIGDTDYQYLWRITYGKCYGTDDLTTPICSIMDGGENEWACKMKYFEAIGGFVGGVHGGERIDLDTTNCFVKFFADGKLLDITDETNDFTIECETFEYIQKAALYIVKDSSTGQVVSGHPLYGYHSKITKLEKCGYNVNNRVEIIENNAIPYESIFSLEYFSGLSCIGKGASTSAFLPTSVLVPQLNGDNSTFSATNTKESKIIFWNDENDIIVEAESKLLQGIEDDAITNLNVYDRSADSKYYRYVLYNSITAVDLSKVSPIVSFTDVKFK